MDKDILLRTREELFRELRERRAIVITLMTRLAILFVAMVGWKLSFPSIFSNTLKFYLAGFVLVITFGATCYLLLLYVSYKNIAEVIVRINVKLGLFQKIDELSDNSILPKEWLQFGKSSLVQVTWIMSLVAIAVVTIILLIS